MAALVETSTLQFSGGREWVNAARAEVSLLTTFYGRTRKNTQCNKP